MQSAVFATAISIWPGRATAGYYRHNVWTIFNEVYDSDCPDGAFTSCNKETEAFADEIYYIGNVVHDSHGAER